MNTITSLNLSVSEKSWTEKDGRIYFKVTTLGLTAKEWVDRLKQNHSKIDAYANMLLDKILADPFNMYDRYHRYEEGKTINIVLIKVKEIEEELSRTEKNLKAIAEKDFSKNSISQLKAELVFLFYEKFSIKELEEMGLMYIVAPHEVFSDRLGRSGFFGIDRKFEDYSFIAEGYGHNKNVLLWEPEGAFAFIESIT